MASENRTATNTVALTQSLQKEPYKYNFYQALRRIECAFREKPRLGESLRPAEDAIRLAQEPSMAFAPSSLSSFSPGKDGRPSRLEVLFFGLFGPNGPVPLHLTEYARDRLRNSGDPTFARFADMFHHRLLSLFYRAWANAQPTVNFDRIESDRFATYLGSLCGLGMPSQRNRDALSDFAKFHFAGRMSCQTKNAEGLLAMLSNFFRMPVNLEQFIGQWLEIPAQSRFRLGESPVTGALGKTTTLGGHVWECQHKFRITIGPLSMDDYRRMLPGGDSLESLVAIVRNYAGDEFDWDVHLILKKEEVKPARLGVFGQLGWTTWTGLEPPDHDVGDLCLNPLYKH